MREDTKERSPRKWQSLVNGVIVQPTDAGACGSNKDDTHVSTIWEHREWMFSDSPEHSLL